MTNPLHEDARSAWAWRRYAGGREPQPIHPAVGAVILNALLPGDHVELIADAVSQSTLVPLPRLSRRERPLDLAVRTLRAWFLVDRGTGGIAVLPGTPSSAGHSSDPGAPWEVTGWTNALKAIDGRHFYFKVFLDSLESPEFAILTTGAGEHIMRLPESPGVPLPPDPRLLSDAPARPLPEQPILPTDWRAAEMIACRHMREFGFPDAALTGGSRDNGLDVVAAEAVAQVKMQGTPVGAPVVQQLRGARPDSPYHLFYSTSGYTASALEAAGELDVCLFRIDGSGAVTAVNQDARSLEHSGLLAAMPDEVVSYVRGVRQRVTEAFLGTDIDRARARELYSGQHLRLWGYLNRAVENVTKERVPASPRSSVIFHHHTELLAAVYFRELGIPYPGGARDQPLPGTATVETLDDYYA
ncbi:restriction endonuclease [Actinoplanes oblitus]|uniref:Restriction endonuclease n=1 Tax=Actinoplanes oblitus TaxID=3040509 RepID=A0ABY8WBE8_9ACTN|nr:restriction endonuclease [Actinoplanes oblitus]WIM95199.1 restriction endonuclease [Actinoplanes oblitus]